MRLIAPLALKNFACRFHRNGIAGIGFYACSFDYLGFSLEAVVFPDSDYYAITLPKNIEQRWHGDHFIEAIRIKIVECEADGSAYSQNPED